MGAIITNQEIITRFKNVHGSRYDYSETEYVDSKSKVKIICKIHGEFYQNPKHHSKGSGCPKCSDKYRVRLTTPEFILKANLVHKNEYSYKKCNYINAHTNVIITCKVHGDFCQLPMNHLKGCGCNSCKNSKIAKSKSKNEYYYLNKFNKIHKYKYDYSEFKLGDYIKVGCPIHGQFIQSLYHHSAGSGCPKCVSKTSKPEIEIQTYIKTIGYNVDSRSRSIISPYELDVYIPDLKKAIEFNGEYWHYSDTYFRPGYHAMKSNMCRKKGVRLLHIRGDLWDKNKIRMLKVIEDFLKS